MNQKGINKLEPPARLDTRPTKKPEMPIMKAQPAEPDHERVHLTGKNKVSLMSYKLPYLSVTVPLHERTLTVVRAIFRSCQHVDLPLLV